MRAGEDAKGKEQEEEQGEKEEQEKEKSMRRIRMRRMWTSRRGSSEYSSRSFSSTSLSEFAASKSTCDNFAWRPTVGHARANALMKLLRTNDPSDHHPMQTAAESQRLFVTISGRAARSKMRTARFTLSIASASLLQQGLPSVPWVQKCAHLRSDHLPFNTARLSCTAASRSFTKCNDGRHSRTIA